MVKIGVVSDTHSLPIPRQLAADFKKVDFIVHAGDFCENSDLEQFLKIGEVKAVFGNMDDAKIRKKFSRRQIIKCEKVSIGLFHGEGSPNSILDSVRREFQKDKLQAVVFGHSHQPFNEVINGVLYFNPGSPNDTIRAPYCSYGILEIDGDRIAGKIVKVKDGNG